MTVRVSAQLLKKLMKSRRAETQSALIQDLLREEEERITALAALHAATGVAAAGDIDASLR